MSAKEMFEKLGYELIEDSKRYLRYANYINKEIKYMGGDMIDFEKVNKQFRLTRKTCQGNTHFKYGSIQELQAISKQCEELGWKMIDILDLRWKNNDYLKFYVKNRYIICENIKTGESVIVGVA